MSCPNACVVFGYGLLVVLSLVVLGMAVMLDVVSGVRFPTGEGFSSSFRAYVVASVCSFLSLLLLLLRVSQLCVSRVPTSENLPSLCSCPFPARGRRLDFAMILTVSVALLSASVGLAMARAEVLDHCGQVAEPDPPYRYYTNACAVVYAMIFPYSVSQVVLLTVCLVLLSCLSCPCCRAVSEDNEFGARRESESRIAAAVATRLFEMTTRRPGYLRVLPGEAEGEGEHENLQHMDGLGASADTAKTTSLHSPTLD